MLNLNPLLTDNVVLQAEHVHLINGMTVPYHPVLLSMGELTLNEMSNSEGEFVFTIPAQSYGVTEKMRIEAGKEKKRDYRSIWRCFSLCWSIQYGIPDVAGGSF
ncbi:hypothetical protein [Enterococcus sp. DIV0098]|uniref:hypothetical protein n=1 Tax=Enterococcus sp. DIV0098 TaxID=2774843 RepID=UPI003F1FA89E